MPFTLIIGAEKRRITHKIKLLHYRNIFLTKSSSPSVTDEENITSETHCFVQTFLSIRMLRNLRIHPRRQIRRINIKLLFRWSQSFPLITKKSFIL